MNEFYELEDMRNTTASQLKQIKLQFGDRIPNQIERHMKHSVDCLNVILATLGSTLVSKSDAVRDMWQMLAEARAALPEAILDFRGAIDLQEQIGPGSAREPVPWEDAEWIARSSAVPRI